MKHHQTIIFFIHNSLENLRKTQLFENIKHNVSTLKYMIKCLNECIMINNKNNNYNDNKMLKNKFLNIYENLSISINNNENENDIRFFIYNISNFIKYFKIYDNKNLLKVLYSLFKYLPDSNKTNQDKKIEKYYCLFYGIYNIKSISKITSNSQKWQTNI